MSGVIKCRFFVVLFGVSWLLCSWSSLFIFCVCFFSWLSLVLVSEAMWLTVGISWVVGIGVSLLIASYCSLFVMFFYCSSDIFLHWSVCSCWIYFVCTCISCSSCCISCCSSVFSWISWFVRFYMWCFARLGTICIIQKTWKAPMKECYF